MYLVEVIIEHPIRHLDATFTYLSRSDIQKGIRVHVPFGPQNLVGYVKNCKETHLTQDQLEDETGIHYKWIQDCIDQTPLLNEELTQLCEYLHYTTFTPFIGCLKTMLPPSLKPSSSAKTSQKKLKVVEYIKDIEDITARQYQHLQIIKQNQKMFLKDCKASRTTLEILEKKGAINIKDEVIYRDVESFLKVDNSEIELTIEQKQVLNELLEKDATLPFLLYGITGSGKTEIYLNATKKMISEGKQVLMLVPEIALTPKMVALFKHRFKDDVAILHSKLSDGQRYDEYLRIASGKVKIVVGARSAIFAPLQNIGLIIMDEEHDGSYKQTNMPCYHTRDIALWRCHYHHAKLLLGSASPSVESYARASFGKYRLLELKRRATTTQLASCQIIDMAKEAKNGNLSMFSKAFSDGLIKCISEGKQALILVNRRGYATYLLCKDCGFIPKCPHCDVTLTYHKESQSLDCHYCGYQIPYQKQHCPSCDSEMVGYKGVGTERMEEILRGSFKNIEVIRYDFDTTKNKSGHEKLLNRFENHEANVLLGTQMIAKGLDFKDVTFVGVLDGDGALSIPDYRSAERTFQLILQVAGRAGRHVDGGEVVIQTYNPKHYAILAGANQDYLSFYKEEIKMRKLANYPPYCYLLSILVCGKDETEVAKTTDKIATYLKGHVSNIEVLGPTPAIIPKINDNYRYRILIKYKQSKQLFREIHEVLKLCDPKIKVEVDVNPYSQM